MGRKERLKSGARKRSKKGKRGFVKFITSAEMIQAALSGLVVAALMVTLSLIAMPTKALFDLLVFRWLVFGVPGVGTVNISLPLAVYKLLLIVAATRAVWYVRNHTEEWREVVEEVSGEETAEDEPDSETATEDDSSANGNGE